MRFVASLAVVLFTGALSGCTQDAPTAATLEPSAAAFNHTGGTEFNEKFPYDFRTWSCTEIIRVSGTVHFVFNVTQDHDGGWHYKGHVNTQNFSGVGETSGDKYQFIFAENGPSKWSAQSADNFTYTSIYKVIRQGSDTQNDDVHGHAIGHLTTNANGEVTATQFEFRFQCK